MTTWFHKIIKWALNEHRRYKILQIDYILILEGSTDEILWDHNTIRSWITELLPRMAIRFNKNERVLGLQG